jgi:hypothetical protein
VLVAVKRSFALMRLILAVHGARRALLVRGRGVDAMGPQRRARVGRVCGLEWRAHGFAMLRLRLPRVVPTVAMMGVVWPIGARGLDAAKSNAG